MSWADEIRADLQQIRNLARDDEGAGVFVLLSERHHPLVAAERRRTRRRNRRTLAVCLAAPLAVLGAVWMLSAADPTSAWVDIGQLRWDILAVFAVLWPLAMILGAAWRSASATLAEQSEETALQLVLTPVRKRTIAAAKVLPHVRPFLWGVLAAMPLYLLAGSTEPFWIEDNVPSVLVPLPWRILASLGSLGSLSMDCGSMDLSIPGTMAGLLMAATDLGLVWAAAHWGAGLAVKTINLPMVGLRILLRLLLVGLMLALYLPPVMLVALLTYPPAQWLFSHGEKTAIAMAVLTFLGFWWVYPLRNAVRGCLMDFAAFDRLAMDPEDPSLRDSVRASAWWWYDGRRA
jgi:hypothetical protein